MKPIKLEIEGLNSFETKQTLDFSSLTGGVFGIFGKTGSGKSTILDAITLSLYGKVERSKQNIDFINTKASKAIVTFEFEIFVSGETKTYKISRVFTKKKNGKDIDSTASLYLINTETQAEQLIEEGTTKVNEKIYEIIGLGVNEFAKCIALPQGEFAAFLQAKPSERTEIMSNIFNLSKYGECLTNKVKERVTEYDKQVSTLSAGRDMVSYATEEKVAETTSQLELKKADYEKKSTELSALSTKWSDLKQRFDKLQNLELLKVQFETLEKEKSTIEKLKSELDKTQVANQIKSDYEKLKKDETDIKDLTEKISLLNETKLQKQTKVIETETDFNNLKTDFDTKIIELNSKISKLCDLEKYDAEIKDAEVKKTEIESEISSKEIEVATEQENNAYFEKCLATIQEQIEKIDEFINSNKSDVELSYALEQTKGVESELMLIDEMYKWIEKVFDQTTEDLKTVQNEYNDAVKQEKELQAQREKIEESIGVAFEDADSSNFNKLRSCDKQIEGMNEVKVEISRVDELIAKLASENDERTETINQIETEIAEVQKKLADFENIIARKEIELESNRVEREEMLGENVISMISDNLKIGELCPVCSSRVITKIYSEKNDLGTIETEIEADKNDLKNMRYERDKIIADLVSLKARVEFEKAQIENNKKEMKNLHESKNSLYQRFVDNNDESAQNFENLYDLLNSTIDSLEELISLQDNLRNDERYACIQKAQAGTKISLYKNTLENLTEILYDLQKKKAEREFVISTVNEKYSNLAEYKKQIADGKNIELLIDDKKEERAKLKDEQFDLSSQKSKSDLLIVSLTADISLLNEKKHNLIKTINEDRLKLTSSGVPEGVLIEDEKLETEKLIQKLKLEYQEKQSAFETSKEELSRTENDYAISSSIFADKQEEVKTLTAKVNASIENNGFSGYEDLENCFADSSIVKLKQEKINIFNDNYRILQTQIEQLENEHISTIDKSQIDTLETEIEKLNEEVKMLTENIGRLSAELEQVSNDNNKLKTIETELAVSKKNYDTAKELMAVLRGKALAEYVCEEYLQEITTEANEKLSMLMDGHYTLKFENKEFFVEDNFNDGEVRPASTLSGGETFVVSLSLALSISSAISMLSSRSMDFFFLDEGFGTLDSELCSIVVSSLYKLESKNLKIGLISHVSELEESIKNRVIVTKDKNGTKLKLEHSL